MSPRNDQRAVHERLMDRGRDFRSWMAQLRESDPIFAEASVLQSETWGEYQAGVYLITGSHEIWTTIGAAVLRSGSLEPVYWENTEPSRGWSTGERRLLRWALQFWNVDANEVQFPYGLDDDSFARWITACHLRHGAAPQEAVADWRSA